MLNVSPYQAYAGVRAKTPQGEFIMITKSLPAGKTNGRRR
jgi:hypothetical protein